MKIYIKFFLCMLIVAFFLSCKKQQIQFPAKVEYFQYFNAQISGQSLSIKGSNETNRDLFSGSWTGIGYDNGIQKEMYTVNVSIPKEILNTTNNSKLRFQIFDIEKKQYLLSSSDSYKRSLTSHIYLIRNRGMDDSRLYTTNETKNPFKIVITRYEKIIGSGLPFVGGKLNGVLYNVKNLQDSIVIKEGVFDVRF